MPTDDKSEQLMEQPEIETPHPEFSFDTPTFEDWVDCPECNSGHVQVRMRKLDEDDTAWFQTNEVLWFECMKCGDESTPEAGGPVEQPDDAGDYSLMEQFKEWLDGFR